MNDECNLTTNSGIDINKLKKTVISRILLVIAALGLMLFSSAGTFLYLEAWVYMAILIIPLICTAAYLLKNDPEILDRRMRMKEREKEQKILLVLSYVYALIVFLLPGFDKRYGWSKAPLAIVIFADVMVLLGCVIFVLVLKENRYASRIIEIAHKHKVITTGPYKVVRHPMYFGALLMYAFTPLALGSYWAMIATILLVFYLIVRILHEEKFLTKELAGYGEYARKVKYRLIPGIW
jgi:protein-S-isoprenylcysteine O-methyltransferase Ste14